MKSKERKEKSKSTIQSFWGQVGIEGNAYAEILQILCDEWITDSICPPQIISGSQFLQTIQNGLATIISEIEQNKRILVFTSTGTISCLLGELLRADPETIFRSAWSLYNCSITTVRYFRDRPMLVSFNQIDHISPPHRTFI